jgi:hypothetical protein
VRTRLVVDCVDGLPDAVLVGQPGGELTGTRSHFRPRDSLEHVTQRVLIQLGEWYVRADAEFGDTNYTRVSAKR